MKKIICLLFAAILVVSATACGNKSSSQSSSEPAELTIKDGYTRYDIEDPNGYSVTGYGAQIDSDVFMPWNNLTDEERKMIEKRIEDMNLQYTRIKMFGEYFERGNDNDDPNTFDFNSKDVDFNSVEMKALYDVLDICEKNHIRVDLCWYNCYAMFKSYDGLYSGTWLGYSSEETGAWCTAPKMTEDFDGYAEQAENMSACFEYLINVKKYTCLYSYSYIAEGFYSADKAIHWDEYTDCIKKIDARMKTDGWRDKLKFNGVANETTKIKVFKELMDPMNGYYDAYGLGNYHWDLNSDIEAIEYFWQDWSEYAKANGKEIVLLEFGTASKHMIDATTFDDTDTYEAGLYRALFVIMTSRYGVTALDNYILGDVFFNNQYIHRLGLWQYRTEGWKARPSYYFYGMCCKYTDVGAQVFNVEYPNENVIMNAYKLPDGKWSYMLVNRSDKTQRIAVVNQRSDKAGVMNVYKMSESLIPENRECVLPEAYTTVDASTGVVYLTLPAMSFTVVSDK